ncbi:serine dehydratase-like [Exaiptasia diaphana]|uniref:L-serine ammonia-lyase n=1 Tax=Exaiptasia diaphana TaxID=2652724 RepID=A0A913WYL0_EXADI|nr:serine dehydratase-like [Exaiptasia diaphana]KXJ27560.1 Serine dehydratase-like [Exaiptasia diaphana]
MQPLHIKTPLLESHPLSKIVGCPVYLKLENIQPVSSFKLRGLGHLCQKAVQNGCKHIVCSSGGNAGLAAAYSARKLNVPCTIIVPSTTPAFMVKRLEEEKAKVIVHGDVWNDADALAQELCKDPEYTYIPPFDHPDIWEGVASLVHEAVEDLQGTKPSVVAVCVGGGGLLCGILQGLHDVGWQDVPVVAMETEGANCLNASLNENRIVKLDGITSIAKCLGSTQVARRAFQWTKEHNIISDLCTDVDALNACLRFADDHRMLVEPGCGATLASVYNNMYDKWSKEGKLNSDIKSILVVVCGGNMVSLEQLQIWKKQLGMS